MTSQALTTKALLGDRTRVSSILATDGTLAPVVLRFALAAVMLPHGVQKAFGWFGGYGWEGTMGFLTESIGMPAVFAASVILLELLGPILLLVGLGTRLVGVGFVGLMIGAITTVHAQHGLFMNWSGTQQGEGIEYHILLIGGALALVLTGGGRWSVDGRLARRGE